MISPPRWKDSEPIAYANSEIRSEFNTAFS